MKTECPRSNFHCVFREELVEAYFCINKFIYFDSFEKYFNFIKILTLGFVIY